MNFNRKTQRINAALIYIKKIEISTQSKQEYVQIRPLSSHLPACWHLSALLVNVDTAARNFVRIRRIAVTTAYITIIRRP